MSRVIKGYCLKYDPETRVRIASTEPAAPPPGAADAAPPPEEFEPMDGEALARSTRAPADAAPGAPEAGSTAPAAPNGAGAGPEGDETTAPPPIGPDGRTTPPPPGGRPAAGPGGPPPSSLLGRRMAELDALDRQLQEWQESLLAREKGLDAEEARLLAEFKQKRQQVDEESDRIIALARKNADQLIANARAEAATLLKAAQVEADEVREKARREGYALGEEKGIAKGEQQGLHEGRLEWQGLIQETETLIQELQTSRIAMLKSTEEEMVRLVLAFAKRVIKVESRLNPAIILKNLDAAIGMLADVDRIVLRINLRDKSMVQSHKDELMRRLQGCRELSIVEDPSLAPGGLRIESSAGTIDATLEVQAEELERQLLAMMQGAGDQR